METTDFNSNPIPNPNLNPPPRVTRGLNKKFNLGATDNIVLNDYSNLRHIQTIEKRIEQLKAKKDIKKNNGSPKLVIQSHYFSDNNNKSPSVDEKKKIAPPPNVNVNEKEKEKMAPPNVNDNNEYLYETNYSDYTLDIPIRTFPPNLTGSKRRLSKFDIQYGGYGNVAEDRYINAFEEQEKIACSIHPPFRVVAEEKKSTSSPPKIVVNDNEFGRLKAKEADKEKEKIATPVTSSRVVVEEKKSKSASSPPKIVIHDNEIGRFNVKEIDKDRDRDGVSDNLKKKLQYAAKELELSSREREMVTEKLNEARLIENGLRMQVKEIGKERDDFAQFVAKQAEKIDELQRAHETNVNELAKKHNEEIAILKGQCEKLTKENEELKKSSNPNPNPKKDTSRMAVLPYAYNLYHALGFEDVPESTNDIEKNKELSALISSKLRKILLVHHPDRPNRPPHSNEVCAWVVNVQGILLDFRKRRLYDSVIAERYFPEGYDNTPRSVAEFSTSRLYVPHGGVFNTDFCALNEFISGVLRVYTPYNEEFLAGADLLPPKPKQSLMYSNSILNRKA